jgi:hypothetical protein
MNTNIYRASLQWLCAFAVVVIASATAGVAQASCVAPKPTVIWSYPAEGDRDVPLDAEIRVIANVTLLNVFEATLDGNVISPSTDGAYPTEGLEPDKDYVFAIAGPKARARSEATPTLLELRFHTGNGLATEPSPPELLSSTRELAMPALDPLCEAVHSAGQCFDTPEYAYDQLELGQTDAVAWLVRYDDSGAEQFWPTVCSPLLTMHKGAAEQMPPCFELRAVGANGSLSESLKYCSATKNGPTGRTTLAQSAADNRAAASCAIAPPGRQSMLGGWFCLAVAPAYLRRWRRPSRT